MSQITGNDNGTILENQIKSLLLSKGYLQLKEELDIEQNWFIPQYRKFKTIYDTQMRLDFYIQNVTKWPNKLAIECKWQSSPGTVDEKFPYVVLNLKSIPCDSVLFLAGGGYRSHACDYIKRHNDDRFTAVEGLDNILKWAQIHL